MDDKERVKRKNQKQLNSLRNKMVGDNLVWFDSLTNQKKYDFLFEWKREKHDNKLKEPKKVQILKRKFVNGRYTLLKVDVMKYPASLKHFIRRSKQMRYYQPVVKRKRDSIINILLNEKK